MEKASRRRLRSASVQLGALTALAVTLAGCDHDDDCDSPRSTPRPRSLALAAYAPGIVPANASIVPANASIVPANASTGASPTGVLPERGGFGTHLASCGG